MHTSNYLYHCITFSITALPQATVTPQVQYALAGSDVAFMCLVTQECFLLRSPSITWSDEHGLLLVNDLIHNITNDEFSSGLRILNVNPFDAGNYTCKVSTSVGSHIAVATLTVQGTINYVLFHNMNCSNHPFQCLPLSIQPESK